MLFCIVVWFVCGIYFCWHCYAISHVNVLLFIYIYFSSFGKSAHRSRYHCLCGFCSFSTSDLTHVFMDRNKTQKSTHMEILRRASFQRYLFALSLVIFCVYFGLCGVAFCISLRQRQQWMRQIQTTIPTTMMMTTTKSAAAHITRNRI